MTLPQALELIGAAAAFTDPPVHPGSTRTSSPQRWADLGCGSGLFTEALARILPPGSTVYGLDRQPNLQEQNTGAGVHITVIKSDFIHTALPLDDLDGILMANSLHYVKDKPALLKKLRQHTKPGCPFLIIEYDTDQPSPVWVPYPIRFESLHNLFEKEGYQAIKKLGERPSVFGRSTMYAAWCQ